MINQLKSVYSIAVLCLLLGIPRSSYYEKINRTESKRSRENRELTAKIKEIHEASNKIYGAPKIHSVLVNKGYKVSIKRVQRRMREAKIRSVTVKKFKPKASKSQIESRKNILNQDFQASKPNQKWVSDITYIHTNYHGWCYLASVMDLCTMRIIGYHFSKSMDTSLVINAIDKAYTAQKPTEPVIMQTDLGTQYTSIEVEKYLRDKPIIQSFSNKGNPYDNACIESFHAILKKEEVYLNTYQSFEHARLKLFQFIEGWYNRNRVHSSINYMTPIEYESLFHSIAC